MWTLPWSPTPPAVAALRVSRSHRDQLIAASTNLAALAAVLHSLGGLHPVQWLMWFQTSHWWGFNLSDLHVAALRRQYSVNATASLPASEAANMFIEMRDFAIDMKRAMITVTSHDTWHLGMLAMSDGRPWWLPQRRAEELLEKWGNVGAREDELQWWLERAAVLVACAEGAIRSCSGGVSWEEDCDGVVDQW